MKIRFDPFLSYWNRREKNEQKALIAGCVIVFIYAIYIFIYTPIQTMTTTQRLQLQDKRETLNWIQKVRPQIQQTSHAVPIQTTELLSIVQKTLSQAPFKSFPSQLNQSNISDVEVKFQRVPFNALIKWMWDLNEHYQLNIKLFEAQISDIPGVCQAHVILSSTAPRHP
jgi:general secretion pathway protein M